VTLRAIAGVVLYDVFLLAVGVPVLFLLRGWRTWGELVRLAGFAFVLGVAVTGVAFVIELVLGLDLSFVTVLATGTGLALAAAGVGVGVGRRLPSMQSGALPAVSLAAAIPAALLLVCLEAFFRAGRLAGLYEFDAWSFWIPKAKAIYYYGGLDAQFFRELPGPTYPPLVPAHDAAVFRFVGSPDVVTLHLLYWSLFAGFVWAVAGLLLQRVRPILVWLPLLLLAVVPYVHDHALQVQADFLLDELLALAGLLLALWLLERKVWQLSASGLLLAGAMSTKREGYLFAACLFVAALAASVRELRRLWPPLLLAGAAAVAVTLPWRIHLALDHLGSGGPEAGGTGLFAHLDRAWPSVRLALSATFDYQIWLVVAPLGVISIGLALLAGARRLGTFAGASCVLLTAGFAWVTWSFPSLPITKEAALNPIVRVTGSLILLIVALMPLLLSSAWTSVAGTERAS
jgi:hypothetical protein